MQRRRLMLVLAVAMTLLPMAQGAQAGTVKEGSLDQSFGFEGQLLDLKSGGFGGLDAAVQSDGKIVVPEGDRVARYTTTGHLDPTFGSGGVVVFGTAFGLGSVAIQPDGKILVAGDQLHGTYDMSLIRLQPSGALDKTFNATGPVPGEIDQPVGTGADQANDVAVQPSGDILLAGYSTSANSDNVVVRYLPNGQPDGGFGTGGIVNLNFTANEHFYGVTDGPNHTIIATGDYESTDGTEDVEVVRLTSDGNLDVSFDSDGVQTTTLSTGDDRGNDVVVGSGGKVFVAASGGGMAQVVAYTSTGALDTGFGAGGGKVFATNSSAAANDLVIERSGKLDVVGSSQGDFVVARMTQAGVLDPHFSGDGVATFGFGTRNDFAAGVAVQRDGKLVVAGGSSSGDSYPALVRVVGDKTPPAAAHIGALSRFTLTRRLALHLHAHDDNTGVASFQVRERVSADNKSTFGAWRIVRARLTGHRLAVALKPGHTYCFDARARDHAGNVGRFGPKACTAAPADDGALALQGAWKRIVDTAAYRATITRTTTHGAVASMHVTFRHLELVATKCPSCGSVRVFLGSRLVKSISLKAATTRHRAQLAILSSSQVRSSTLRIVVTTTARAVPLDGVGISLT